MDQNINIFPEKGGDTSLRITILDEKKTDRQVMQTLVLLIPHSLYIDYMNLTALATSLRAGFQVYLSKLWVVDVTKEVRYDLLIYFLLSQILFSTFYLLLQPLLELGSKSTSLSSGFSELSKQRDTIC